MAMAVFWMQGDHNGAVCTPSRGKTHRVGDSKRVVDAVAQSTQCESGEEVKGEYQLHSPRFR